MLVLSRKLNEQIVLKIEGHEPITLTVVSIDRDYRVRIGIQAEREVVINRKELLTEKPA